MWILKGWPSTQILYSLRYALIKEINQDFNVNALTFAQLDFAFAKPSSNSISYFTPSSFPVTLNALESKKVVKYKKMDVWQKCSFLKENLIVRAIDTHTFLNQELHARFTPTWQKIANNKRI